MKTLSRALVMVILGLAVVASLSMGAMVEVPTPILEYKFNSTGDTSPSTGSNSSDLLLVDMFYIQSDLHSEDGLGVSGQAGDRALDLTSAEMMGFGPDDKGGGLGPKAQHATVCEDIAHVLSFTITGWYKATGDMLPGHGARLFSYLPRPGYDVSFAPEGRLQLQVIGDLGQYEVQSTEGPYAISERWMFFAVTYDGAKLENNVKFYVGDKDTPVAQVGAPLSAPADMINAGGAYVNIGNYTSRFDVPFKGYLDNMRVFGAKDDSSGALTLEQLELLRQGDVGL